MAESNLAFIGAILSISLGFFALNLIRKNENLKWNEAIAGHLISLIFICKGLQSAASGYFEDALNSGLEGETIWQFWAQFLTIMDYAFGSGIIMIALLYPIPFLRNKKQLKVGSSIIATLFIFIPLTLDVTGNPWTVFHLTGLLYLVGGFAWGSIYIYFKLINEKERNESTKNISMVCGLFLTLQMGHIWMMWPGMFLQADYFYFIDLGSTGVGSIDITSTMFDYFWLVGYTFCIAVGLTMLAVEIYQAINGNSSIMLYILSFYFIIGTIGYAILSSTGGSAFGINSADSDIKEMWKTFTSQMHFTVLRSLIALYILLKYSFFDINEQTKPLAKLMAIILIVVATSAVLELVQSIIPLNQMITAALLGIIIAFGIGWEEKSFDSLVANPANINDSIDKKWYPSIELPEGVLKKLDIACWIFIIVAALLSLIVWKTDGILSVVLERGGVS